jgi:hypothetical protein
MILINEKSVIVNLQKKKKSCNENSTASNSRFHNARLFVYAEVLQRSIPSPVSPTKYLHQFCGVNTQNVSSDSPWQKEKTIKL